MMRIIQAIDFFYLIIPFIAIAIVNRIAVFALLVGDQRYKTYGTSIF